MDGSTNAMAPSYKVYIATSPATGLSITQQQIVRSGNIITMNCELYNTAQIAGYTTLFTIPPGTRPEAYLFCSATCLATDKASMPIQIKPDGTVLSPWNFTGGNYYFELNVTYVVKETA